MMRFLRWVLPAAALLAACSTKGTATLNLFAAPQSISNIDGVGLVIAEAFDATGKAGTGSVSLTSTAGSFVTPSSQTLDYTGHATFIFTCAVATDPKCTGTVSFNGTWTTLSASASIRVQGLVDAGPPPPDSGSPPDAGSGDGGVPGVPANIVYADLPGTLPIVGIQSSGRDTTTPISFQLIDANHLGVPGQGIAFSVGGGATVIDAGVTDGLGYAFTILTSGDEVGIASVTATYTPNDGGTPLVATSPGTAIVGALPSDLGFVVACNNLNLSANSSVTPPRPDITTTCTAKLNDRFSNPVGIPTLVEWYSEAGSINSPVVSKPFATLDAGIADPTIGFATTDFSSDGKWPPADVAPLPGEPNVPTTDIRWVATGLNPRDMLVTMIAVTPGEEAFFDGSGTSNGVKNGKWDPGEWFIDVSEPFVDENDNQQWDPGEPFIDEPWLNCATGVVEPPNGKWDPPNGCWDGNILLWLPVHVVYSGPVTRLILDDPPPYVVPQTPAVLQLGYHLADDFFIRLAPDNLQLTTSIIGQRAGADLIPNADTNLESYGFTVNYRLVQETETSPGVFQVDGTCDPSAPFTGSTTLPIKTRCMHRYDFSNFGFAKADAGFSEGDNGILDLIGQSPSSTGASAAQIDINASNTYTATTFAIPVTFQ
jgi:hypothetical protein